MTTMKVTNAIDGQWVDLPLVYNSNVETDTGYDLPEGGVIYPWEMFLIVTAIDATETIDIGIGMATETGYDANGFVAASIAPQTLGRYCVANLYTATDASSQNYLSANYIGALFFGGLAGGNAAGTAGIYALEAYIGDGVCKSICYTCSSGSDTFEGRLVFKVHQLPLWAIA
jgi:hypothetical protein